jgi:hypothetical protein
MGLWVGNRVMLAGELRLLVFFHGRLGGVCRGDGFIGKILVPSKPVFIKNFKSFTSTLSVFTTSKSSRVLSSYSERSCSCPPATILPLIWSNVPSGRDFGVRNIRDGISFTTYVRSRYSQTSICCCGLIRHLITIFFLADTIESEIGFGCNCISLECRFRCWLCHGLR